MRRRWMLIVLVLAIFLLPKHGFANDANAWSDLNQIAGQVLQFTKQQQYDDAKRLIGLFADDFVEYEFEDQVWTMSSLRTLTSAFENAEQALVATDMSSEERIRHVTAFRLTADSLNNSDQPLWKSMELPVMDALDALEDAAAVADGQALKHELNGFQSLYAMLRPALQISIGSDEVAKFDSYNAFLVNQETTGEQAEDHIDTMRQSYKLLFHDDEKDHADPMLYWVMLTIGGPVIASLTYVGFRKYRAEKRKVKAKE